MEISLSEGGSFSGVCVFQNREADASIYAPERSTIEVCIPGYVQRGSGFDVYFEYEVKVSEVKGKSVQAQKGPLLVYCRPSLRTDITSLA